MYEKDDERMHLEADLENVLFDWIESAVDNMTLQELRDVTQKLDIENLTELKLRNPRRDK